MALPVKYKFMLKNETGVDILAGEALVRITRSKHGPSDNAIVYESPLAASLSNAAIIANGSWGDIGGIQDNRLNLFEEGVGTLECVISTPTPNGDVTLVLAASSDTVFADAGNNPGLLAVMTVTVVTLTKKGIRFR